MKYYAVIDTNVLVSALLKRDSIPREIIELAFKGIIIPVLNEKIENEYRGVLSRPKFHFTDSVIHGIITSFQEKGLYIDPKPTSVVLNDPKDLIFYEIVMAQRIETDAYLITGNIKHFPAAPFIITPHQMLNTIAGE